jgi:type I restriction enzyme M protein
LILDAFHFCSLDIFWIKDKSLEDAESLPEPDVLAKEIADDLQTAMDLFGAIATELKPLAGTAD